MCAARNEIRAQLQRQQNHQQAAVTLAANQVPAQTSPLLVDQIAHLLNLAQILMRAMKDEPQHPPLQLRIDNPSRRNIRMQANPYQRPVNEGTRFRSRMRTRTMAQQQSAINELDGSLSCECNECLSYRTQRMYAAIATREPGQGSSGNPPDNQVAPHINFNCSICLEPYLTQCPTATACGHIFCGKCILESLKWTQRCPICNGKLNVTKVFRVFF